MAKEVNIHEGSEALEKAFKELLDVYSVNGVLWALLLGRIGAGIKAYHDLEDRMAAKPESK
jgi:hypothetical protein